MICTITKTKTTYDSKRILKIKIDVDCLLEKKSIITLSRQPNSNNDFALVIVFVKTSLLEYCRIPNVVAHIHLLLNTP